MRKEGITKFDCWFWVHLMGCALLAIILKTKFGMYKYYAFWIVIALGILYECLDEVFGSSIYGSNLWFFIRRLWKFDERGWSWSDILADSIGASFVIWF